MSQTTLFSDYYRTVLQSYDTNKLHDMHDEVSKELSRRLLNPEIQANPELSSATVSKLLKMLDEIFNRVMFVLSMLKNGLDQTRYAGWALGWKTEA